MYIRKVVKIKADNPYFNTENLYMYIVLMPALFIFQWTCVHDIQGERKPSDKRPRSPSSATPLSPSTGSERLSTTCSGTGHDKDGNRSVNNSNIIVDGIEHYHSNHSATPSTPNFRVTLPTGAADLLRSGRLPNLQNFTQVNFGLPGILELSDSSESDIDSEFEDDIIDHSMEQPSTNNLETRNNAADTTGIDTNSRAGNSIEDFLASDSESDVASGDEQITNAVMYLLNSNLHEGRSRQGKVHQNEPRLVAYAEEPNVGRGFIKELCFSTDGRLICSPFGFGVRLMAFDPHCNELCDCVPNLPVKLYEVTTVLSHTNNVVTTKFSPTHCTLVSGCLNGRITFCQPVL